MVDSAALVDLDKIVSLCKRRGFIFQSSEIYGGLASTWDYGPLGAELKRNLKDAWWRAFIWGRDDVVGLDSAILMHPEVWRASGHVERFTDPKVECKNCGQHWRADQLSVGGQGSGVRGLEPESGRDRYPDPRPLTPNPQPRCPACGGELTEPRQFNLMFKTFMGPIEEDAAVVYLRPETAQGIFVNFNNVLMATRRKLPFGIGQIGKAFRNEITTGNFIFRTREFEIMEIEYFVKPGEDEACHQRWIEDCLRWYTDLGVSRDRLRVRQHEKDELSHYSKATFDIEYRFPWGWGEIQGIANRTDYDLKAHSERSGESLSYFDEETRERFTPYVVEPAAGVDRALMTFLIDAYAEEDAPTGSGGTEKRVVLKLHPALAPVKVAILPLSRNEKLVPLAREVHDKVRRSGAINGMVQYDDAQSIGRRYRRQDEVGTPLCVTVDFDSLNDNAVTIRERDSMAQIRVPIAELVEALKEKLYQRSQHG